MATSSEGKTSEDSAADSTVTDTPLCDACEDDKAVKYCIVCPGSLCDDCTKSHMKSKLTKDHTLCDISISRLGSSYTRSGEGVDGLSKCVSHTDKELDHFCKDCSSFVCVDCKRDHNNHKILSARNDLSIYRSAYHECMKQMMDKVHDFEQCKITLEKTIHQYEETCTEVDEKAEDLIQTIKDNQKRLKKELRTVQGKLKQVLGDAKSGLVKEIEDADTRVSQLRDLRRVEDCEVMSHGLAIAREDIIRLNNYKTKITPQARTVDSMHILPFREEMDAMKEDVCLYYSTEFPISHTIESYFNMTSKSTSYVSNPQGEQGYRFVKPQIGDHLLIHGKNTNDIRLLKDTYTVHKEIKCDISIWNLITVYLNEHVAIHRGSDTRPISLLDGNFNVVFTQKEPARDIRAICCYAPHQFLLCEVNEKRIRFSIVQVKGRTFQDIKEISIIPNIQKPWYMEICPDKEHVYLACSTECLIYKVNMKKSTFTKQDLSAILEKPIWSLCVEGDGAFIVGDNKGTIYKFDEHGNHDIISTISKPARGIFMTEDCVLVSSTDNKIYVFS